MEDNKQNMTDFIAQNVAAGNYHLIDVAEERKKPIPISFEEFAEKLKGYSITDYLNSQKPYDDLFIASQSKTGLFSQCATVMLADADKKKRNNNELSRIGGKIYLTEMMIFDTDSSNDINLYITKVATDENKKGQVSVLPLLCGSGKSTALTIKVINTIIRIESVQCDAQDIRKDPSFTELCAEVTEERFEGLVIVTDSKERLKKIWDPDPNNKYINKDFRNFIDEHKTNWVSIITDDNAEEEEKKQRYSPVLCVTTQRYFGWKKEEILRHLEWEDENGIHKRPLIIFDEQPYLNAVKDISIATINNIDTALRTTLYKTWIPANL